MQSDMFHMRLIDALIVDSLRQDALDKSKRVGGLDRAEHKHLVAFEEFMSKIGMSGFMLTVDL